MRTTKETKDQRIKVAEKAARLAGWHRVTGTKHTWECGLQCMEIGYPAGLSDGTPARTRITPKQACDFFAR